MIYQMATEHIDDLWVVAWFVIFIGIIGAVCSLLSMWYAYEWYGDSSEQYKKAIRRFIGGLSILATGFCVLIFRSTIKYY